MHGLFLLAGFFAGCGGESRPIDVSLDQQLALDGQIHVVRPGGPQAPAEEGAELWLHVTRTEVHVAQTGGSEGKTGWSVVNTDPIDVNLLALESGPEQIAQGEVPLGKLTQVRLVLDSEAPAHYTTGESTWPVRVASGGTSGLKLHLVPPVDLEAASEVELVLLLEGRLELRDGEWWLTPSLRLGSGETTPDPVAQ
jgi:hypothetical protein